MILKKISISIIITIIIITINSSSTVYAASDWVQQAFSAAKTFLQDKEVEDNLGKNTTFLLTTIQDFIKAVNITLLVLLASLSAISLSVVGVKYIMAGASPADKENAKKSLHTVFIGMIYGFGAYVIWTVAIQVINLIINAFATS